MRSTFLLTASAALMVTACGGETEKAGDETMAAKTESSAPAQESKEQLAARNLAAAEAFLEENAKRDGVTVTESGLQYMIIEEGAEGGIQPESTDLVQVHYVGTLIDGVEFDSSRARGAAASFKLNQVIRGWTEGVQLMSEGDTYRFFVPPALGYGERGGRPGGKIGPNDALIFEVELIKVQSGARNLEKANAFLEANAKKDGVVTTESGLQYEVISKGKEGGASPKETDQVKVHYAGTLLNGTTFDSSVDRGEPATFPLNRVIPGWTEGVQLMSEGDKFRFFIKPDLAYGERGREPIGPNEALVFEVELLEVVTKENAESAE